MAYGTVQAQREGLAMLRKTPLSLAGKTMPGAFLKHADEQTIVALAAIGQAIGRFGLQETVFTDWGVLAAPRFQGRLMMIAALEKYVTEGAWGISPHLIPHRSLHATSGTVSQVLGIHGPNFGIGGGPSSASEAMLAATAMLARERVPGIWLVLTGWDPEPVPDDSTPEGLIPQCSAVALALTLPRSDWSGLRLRVVPGTLERDRPVGSAPECSLLRLESLLAVLRDGARPTQTVWRLEDGGWMSLGQSVAASLPQGFRRAG